MKKRILFLCLSHQWGTKEKRALNDCIHYSQTSEVEIYCHRDSFLDKYARKFHLKISYYGNRGHYFDLKKFFKINRYDVIHCYDVDYLTSLCLSINNNLTSLFVTLFSESFTGGMSFWEKFFIRRVDRFFVTSKEMGERVSDIFNIPLRLTQDLGHGIGEVVDAAEVNLREVMNVAKNTLLIGTLVENHIEDISTILPMLNAIQPFLVKLENEGIKRKVRFVLFSERAWEESMVYSQLKLEANKRGALENIEFISVRSFRPLQNQLDLWVGLKSDELISDAAAMALLEGIPVILPRNSLSSEIIRSGELGETYFPRDSRELRDAILRVMSNLKKLKGYLSKEQKSLHEVFGSKRYYKSLTKEYFKAHAKRHRFFQTGASKQ